jgi:hypothetical protein
MPSRRKTGSRWFLTPSPSLQLIERGSAASWSARAEWQFPYTAGTKSFQAAVRRDRPSEIGSRCVMDPPIGAAYLGDQPARLASAKPGAGPGLAILRRRDRAHAIDSTTSIRTSLRLRPGPPARSAPGRRAKDEPRPERRQLLRGRRRIVGSANRASRIRTQSEPQAPATDLAASGGPTCLRASNRSGGSRFCRSIIAGTTSYGTFGTTMRAPLQRRCPGRQPQSGAVATQARGPSRGASIGIGDSSLWCLTMDPSTETGQSVRQWSRRRGHEPANRTFRHCGSLAANQFEPAVGFDRMRPRWSGLDSTESLRFDDARQRAPTCIVYRGAR